MTPAERWAAIMWLCAMALCGLALFGWITRWDWVWLAVASSGAIIGGVCAWSLLSPTRHQGSTSRRRLRLD